MNLGISLSVTLAIVSMSIAIASIWSKSLGGGIKSLGDWVKTSAGGEWYAIAKNLWISLTLAIDTSTIDTGIANIARDRVVESIYTRSTLQSCAIAKNLGIPMGRDPM